MEKKELQKLFRDYMKSHGFKSKGNVCTKYLADDYLVFAILEHSSFGSEYGVEYGVVYEADQLEKPFNGMMADWSDCFSWPLPDGGKSPYRFDYNARTAVDFTTCLDWNMAERFSCLNEREYVLDQYRNNWFLYRAIPYVTVQKICRLAGISPEVAIAVRDSKCKTAEMIEDFLRSFEQNPSISIPESAN